MLARLGAQERVTWAPRIMFDPIKEAVCPRLKSCWPCVRPDFAVHRLNRKGLLLLLILIRTPISPTVIIILPSHCCSVYYAVQDFFFFTDLLPSRSADSSRCSSYFPAHTRLCLSIMEILKRRNEVGGK